MSRQSTTYSPEASFFERERERLIQEISSVGIGDGFEELVTHTNVLNRKLEEVYGVGKEFSTVAQLWGRFNQIVQDKQNEPTGESGVPGTGGTNFGASVGR